MGIEGAYSRFSLPNTLQNEVSLDDFVLSRPVEGASGWRKAKGI